MKKLRFGIAALASLLALVVVGLGAAAPPPPPGHPPGPGGHAGTLYTETNQAANAVAIYTRAPNGTLTAAGTVATGGAGTGAPLGSQGAVTLSQNGSELFVVNAGDDTVSAFAVRPNGLTLQDVVSSGGTDPISVTSHGNLVYVLNAGSPGISGFTVNPATGLTPLPGSTQPLSGGAASPEQVSFSQSGSVLIVAEKGSGTIDTFRVGPGGIAGAAQTTSAGGGPYGFGLDNHGNLIISLAGAGASSSYSVSPTGVLTPISSMVSTGGQAAPCWLVVTPDGRYAYTANAGSGTISLYGIANGQLTLLNDIVAFVGAHPLDEAVGTQGGGSYFSVVGDGIHTLETFRLNPDGSLTLLSTIAGLPVGDAGLATT